MAAQGAVLTDKYAEGYRGRRYYGGCEHVDVVEQLAIDRLKALFGATGYRYGGISARCPAGVRCDGGSRHDPVP